MSTPLASEQVKEIRDIFDYQLRNPELTEATHQKQQQQTMNPDRLREEKEALLTRLASSKQQLDSKMDNYYTRRRLDDEKPVNQTMDVKAVDATWMQGSEESFLRWEEDCEQTMLPIKQQSQDPEMAAMERLMREYNLDQRADDPDQTQLEDVEPPSGIWETTIVSAKMTSPVKMMHAMRHSTIIEESSTLGQSTASEENNISLASSYKTAASIGYSKMTSAVAPSEQYETATETICLSSPDNSSANVIEILDDSLESRAARKISSSNNDTTAESNASSVLSTLPVNNTLDGISSLMPDTSSASSVLSKDSGDFSLPLSRDSLLDDTPDFNDTLERIEFMEQQGKKLLEQQKTNQTPQRGEQPGDKNPSTPLLAKTLLPLTSSSKRVFYPSPNSLNSSSGTFKKPGQVRSPQVKFVPPKRNFDHIVSPIATYIKDCPTSTLYTKYKGQCLFSKNSPIKPNTPTKEETKENKQTQIKPPQWNIPRKVFTATNNRHVSGQRRNFNFLSTVDEKTKVTNAYFAICI